MKRRDHINAMFRGENIRRKTGIGQLPDKQKLALKDNESIYLCQQIYSALKPLYNEDDQRVHETKMYPGFKYKFP